MDFSRPDSITADGVRQLSLRDIVLAVNDARRMDRKHDHPQGNNAALVHFLRGQAMALRQLYETGADGTLAVQPMFYGEQHGRWLRPAFGLKRTYSPFIVREAGDR
ncbi:small capsid protein [Leporid alphaherpesvirus 4]|uniref:Small capsomere-interacting protein n=1 Tax=Leporid alphaherpesvirus 4 TaxID=481315 RepID=J9QQS7_9ALPH|nr:small capsid protein [Leporid alphaherpesvirus 4]AFR32476.1 small capsid protein [Leporid alphaherpesvirus 4]